MKTTLNTAALLLSLFFIIQFTACRKKDVIPPAQPETCRITEMEFTSALFTNTSSTATFTYNAAGNPVSVLMSKVGTGNPHALFLYDKYNRLTDYIGSYTGFTDPANMPDMFVFEYWVRYAYADQNPSSMPVQDTLRVFGSFEDGKFGSTYSTTIETLSYDSQGRIIRDNGYDAKGNLIIPNVTYDNRNNFRRTNKVWMLIDRNYSVNNPFTATTYNAAGFPLTIATPALPYSYNDIFLRRNLKILTLNYSCTKDKTGK